MNITRWQRPEVNWPTLGFGRLSSLHDEIDRLFEAPLAEFARQHNVFGGWSPALDIYEQKDNVVVRAELPGMKKEDIDVSLHENTLSISGERKHEESHKDEAMYRSERFFGRFQRSVVLPTPVAVDKIKAQYKDGVLTVTLPKAEEAKPKQINVNIN